MGDPLIHKVDCVRFYVPDLDAGLEFYRDHLGHQLLWRTDKAVGLGMSGTDAEIVLQVEREGPETDLKVDSADAAAARVQMAGGQIIVPPFDIQIGRCAVVEDQWGNRMVLVDSTKGCLLTDDEGHVTSAGVADQMDHPLHVVNAQATVVREGRYLMIVRGEFEEHAPGALSPPGGKVEHGDDETGVLESTVRREVLEETGVTVGEIFMFEVVVLERTLAPQSWFPLSCANMRAVKHTPLIRAKWPRLIGLRLRR